MAKRITIKDVATYAQVGVSTVSAVLSNKDYCYVSDQTRKKIKQAAEKLGYIPSKLSRALHGLPTATIGIVGSVFSVAIHTEFMSYLSRLFWDNNYQIFIGDSCSDPEREKEMIKEFAARGVDGLIISGVLSRSEIENVAGGIPCVVSGTLDMNSKLELGVDLHYGGYILAKHLLEQDISTIIYFSTKLKENKSKYDGLLKAVAEAGSGIKVDVIDIAGHDIDWGIEECYKRYCSDDIDAFMCSNDIMAANLMSLLLRHGVKIPEDVIVAGYDGITVSELYYPSITTVKQPMKELADSCYEQLVNRMKGAYKQTSGTEFIKPELIVGDSSNRKG